MEPFVFFLVAGGAAAYQLASKGRAHARWKPVFEDAARRLGGRASTATMFEAPELQADVEGTPVSLRLQNVHKNQRRTVAVAEASLPEGLSGVRLYFGWDVTRLSRDLEYIAEIPFPRAFGLAGRVHVRADDAAVAHRFAERASADLLSLRQESTAEAIEVLARGGSVRIAVHGLSDTAWVIERVVKVAARMAGHVNGAVSGRPAPEPIAPRLPTPPPKPPEPEKIEPETFEEARCALCSEKRVAKKGWVRCIRCSAPYHEACFLQATGCVADGCSETRSRPAD
jgi:hypothetical protein